MARKQPGQLFFLFFLVLNLFYSLHERSNGLITEKTILFQGSRVVQHFRRGVQLLPGGGGGGVKMLISIEPHITCDFPAGSGPLSPSGSAHEQRSSKN